MTYLKQSLTIRQQIGNKAGLCATLFNMGHIHAQNNQIQEAVQAWVTVYVIAKQMNLAQALQALAKLAPQLGMPEGLGGWEQLAQRMQSGAGDETAENETEENQIVNFVEGVVQAVITKSPNTEKYDEAVSKMAVDPEAPPEFQELGKVLRQFMSGVKPPDLTSLPKALAEIVRKALDRPET